MRALWNTRGRRDALSDALTLLAGWTREDRQLRRVFTLDDAQHAALIERIKVCADAMHQRAEIRRLDGHTQVKLDAEDGATITEHEVSLAARIEDAYRTVVADKTL
jgi:4a-hydroxytetrahydrobiopterin dehydratase